jgi:hypothetical protein
VAQPEIRTEVVRYVTTMATTLRPTTVAGRTKALLVFFDFLAEHDPRVRRLDQIERAAHIEPYLAWARHRPWRGPNGRDRTVSLTLSTRTSSTCGASSRTSPAGTGPRRRGGA